MKLAVVAYIPPPTYGCATTFYENLMRHKPKFPLLLYSDHPWDGAIRLKVSPDQIRLMQEAKVRRTAFNKWTVNNAVFLTGMALAKREGYTRVIYLESDCRVAGENWDERIFDEYYGLGRPCIGAGTLACYNTCNFSREAAMRWSKLVAGNVKRNMPIATYGWVGAANKHVSCVFPNGALSVLDVNWISDLFNNLENTVQTADDSTAWDMALGQKVWDLFAEDSFEVFGMLHSVFSSYGDVLTTEAERLQWLREGKYCAVHQCKSNETI
jgi:hypothetical protein